AYSFGPKITWPIFHWGAIKNNIRVQSAREEQYLAAYEKTILTAVGEVRNALTSEVRERQRNASLKLGLDAAKDALSVANDKYNSGLTDYNNVIIAQKAYLTLSEQYAISSGELTSNIVRLFKALGGGWEPME
ncbi:MAG: TolC family protein, partial [Synergistaceae bacterium]|nr:TolC family protein [Synergistaceae bacterium]